MSSLKFNLLGSFHALLDGQSINELRFSRLQALLIYLSVEPLTAHRREMFCTPFWPGMSEKSAWHNLSQAFYALRQSFPDVAQANSDLTSLILANRQTVQLNPVREVVIDLHQMDRLLDESKVHDHLNLAN